MARRRLARACQCELSDGAWGYAAFPLFGADPEIGDRVLFEPPDALGSKVPYLKTVRGLPGMTVEVGATERSDSMARRSDAQDARARRAGRSQP